MRADVVPEGVEAQPLRSRGWQVDVGTTRGGQLSRRTELAASALMG